MTMMESSIEGPGDNGLDGCSEKIVSLRSAGQIAIFVQLIALVPILPRWCQVAKRWTFITLCYCIYWLKCIITNH